MALAATLWLTLRPNPDSVLAAPTPCCAASDLVFNVLLFVPLGIGLALLGLRPRLAVAAGALLSAAIELAQHWWVAGRFASPYDVAANVAGCFLGVLMVTEWSRRARWWPLVAPFIAVAVVLAWFLGGYLAQPAIPGPSRWIAEVAHAPEGMSPFTGEVIDVRLQGVALPDGAIDNLPTLRARLAASRKVELAATIVTGVAPRGRSRLFEIVVGEGTVPFLILEQEGGALRAYQRLGLSWVGLRGPWLELKDALSSLRETRSACAWKRRGVTCGSWRFEQAGSAKRRSGWPPNSISARSRIGLRTARSGGTLSRRWRPSSSSGSRWPIVRGSSPWRGSHLSSSAPSEAALRCRRGRSCCSRLRVR